MGRRGFGCAVSFIIIKILLDDLKLTYQLENHMLPVDRREQDVVRFLRELVIDILNNPEYGDRTIHFENGEEEVLYLFDQKLFTRAFQNLILNAFVHGNADTEVTLQIDVLDSALQISVADNGNGLDPEERERLFDRYYRGVNTDRKREGSGLGLAITKSIVELHGGRISVFSTRGSGTVFRLEFPY